MKFFDSQDSFENLYSKLHTIEGALMLFSCIFETKEDRDTLSSSVICDTLFGFSEMVKACEQDLEGLIKRDARHSSGARGEAIKRIETLPEDKCRQMLLILERMAQKEV